MTTIRAFIAIPLPQTLLRQLAQVQRQLEKEIPPGSVRWVRPEGIHLTLKFLGDTPLERLPPIQEALKAVAFRSIPCIFTVGGLGCFPNYRRPRVIWVGVLERTGRLAALQDAVEEAVAPLGYPPEGRGFSPHLTLGRVSRQASPSDVARIGAAVSTATVSSLGEVPARHFALIQSVLKPSGAVYTTLAEFPLGLSSDEQSA